MHHAVVLHARWLEDTRHLRAAMLIVMSDGKHQDLPVSAGKIYRGCFDPRGSGDAASRLLKTVLSTRPVSKVIAENFPVLCLRDA